MRYILLIGLFLSWQIRAQVVNYVPNGSFEECGNCDSPFPSLDAKGWGAINPQKYYGFLLSRLPPSGQVPLSSYAYQWPRHGNNYILSTLFVHPETSFVNVRGYPRVKLRQLLKPNQEYCVKFYCNVTHGSTYGVDAVGAFFGGDFTDTISQCNRPITYLNPQIRNQSGNVITDTMNWVLIQGTFIANGDEQYLMIGNFETQANTQSVVIRPAGLPMIATEMFYDDVSCIEADLPAFAGEDKKFIKGDSVYLGREKDVGIDEACTWYKLPGAVPIDTSAGMGVFSNLYCAGERQTLPVSDCKR